MNETPAALHGRRSALMTKLNAALLAGANTEKIRTEIASCDIQLAAAAHRDAVAREAAERALAAKVQAAASETTSAIYARVDAVLADIATPEEPPMETDPAIEAASLDLERANNSLAEANEAFAEAQSRVSQITGRIARITADRQTIVARRAGGETRVSDRNDLSCADADLEGLRALEPEATAALNEARQTVGAATSSRQRAAQALSAAEDFAVAAHLVAAASELDARLSDALRKLQAIDKRQHRRASWIGSHDLRGLLRTLEVQNPNLAAELNPSHPSHFRRAG